MPSSYFVLCFDPVIMEAEGIMPVQRVDVEYILTFILQSDCGIRKTD